MPTLHGMQAIKQQQAQPEQPAAEQQGPAAPDVALSQNAVLQHTAQLKSYLTRLQKPFLQFAGEDPGGAAAYSVQLLKTMFALLPARSAAYRLQAAPSNASLRSRLSALHSDCCSFHCPQGQQAALTTVQCSFERTCLSRVPCAGKDRSLDEVLQNATLFNAFIVVAASAGAPSRQVLPAFVPAPWVHNRASAPVMGGVSGNGPSRRAAIEDLDLGRKVPTWQAPGPDLQLLRSHWGHSRWCQLKQVDLPSQSATQSWQASLPTGLLCPGPAAQIRAWCGCALAAFSMPPCTLARTLGSQYTCWLPLCHGLPAASLNHQADEAGQAMLLTTGCNAARKAQGAARTQGEGQRQQSRGLPTSTAQSQAQHAIHVVLRPRNVLRVSVCRQH